MKKWPFIAIILPWMARYGSKRSFLLIFSARDDLVKVSWKSDAGKCPNQVTPPYFDQLSERHQLLYTIGKNFTLPPALTAWTNSTSAICFPVTSRNAMKDILHGGCHIWPFFDDLTTWSDRNKDILRSNQKWWVVGLPCSGRRPKKRFFFMRGGRGGDFPYWWWLWL